MRGIFWGLIAAVTLLAGAAQAAAVRDCDETANVRNIAEPWEKNTRAFYNGQVRVALVDTGGEPVCCSVHLLVLTPVKSEEGGDYRVCHLINNDGDLGFVNIDFAKLTSTYDSGKGLLISFPYELYNDGNPGKRGVAKVRVNLAKGTVAVEK